MDISSSWPLVATGCAIACASVGLWLARRPAGARPKPPARHPLTLDTVGFAAREGAGWVRGDYLPVPAGRAAVVLVNGPDRRRGDALAQALRAQGLSVLAMEASRQGDPEAVLGAVDYLLDRGHPPGRIGLVGEGPASIAVLAAAAREPAVRAVLAVDDGTTSGGAARPDPARTVVCVRPVAHTARTAAFFAQHLQAPRAVCVIWPRPARVAPAVAWERLPA